MEHEVVSYKQAIVLDEIGYDTIHWFGNAASLYDIMGYHAMYVNYGIMLSGINDGYISAPLKQQVFRWFRNMYGFHFYSYEIKLYPDGDYPTKIWHGKINDEFVNTENGLAKSHFYSYEEAENACIDKLIELVKQ
jgi:hypothetical protein